MYIARECERERNRHMCVYHMRMRVCIKDHAHVRVSAPAYLQMDEKYYSIMICFLLKTNCRKVSHCLCGALIVSFLLVSLISMRSVYEHDIDEAVRIRS